MNWDNKYQEDFSWFSVIPVHPRRTCHRLRAAGCRRGWQLRRKAFGSRFAAAFSGGFFEMTARVFIDGEAGTTGLQIRSRLAGRDDLEFLSLGEAERKDPARRRAQLNAADVVILCLPDDAAREAVTLIDNPEVRVIDASSAHRTDPDWTYGFPEMAPGQAERIASAKRVSNPGCYPTGVIALTRPLVEAGLLPRDFPLTVNAVSGYSGGGRKLIERHENPCVPDRIDAAYHVYGLKLAHKHVEEMRVHAGLDHRPLFVPSVGRVHAGMITQIPQQLWAQPARPSAAQVHETLVAAYDGCDFVSVATPEQCAALERLEPEGLNGTNELRLHVFPNSREDEPQVLLAAIYDNLGKGASGAAVQNLNLMLGTEQATGTRLVA
jgi:N-acetyl-gamma-glutamyl-phosphate reductase